MKKIFITLFSLILISGLTINASACGTCGCQKDAKKECSGNIESSSEDKTTKSCSKSKKECCKSKNNSSSSKSSKNGSFNFDKSNNYTAKAACSNSKTKKCCKTKVDKSNSTEEVKSDDKSTNK
jgi:hypothetical protein